MEWGGLGVGVGGICDVGTLGRQRCWGGGYLEVLMAAAAALNPSRRVAPDAFLLQCNTLLGLKRRAFERKEIVCSVLRDVGGVCRY